MVNRIETGVEKNKSFELRRLPISFEPLRFSYCSPQGLFQVLHVFSAPLPINWNIILVWAFDGIHNNNSESINIIKIPSNGTKTKQRERKKPKKKEHIFCCHNEIDWHSHITFSLMRK